MTELVEPVGKKLAKAREARGLTLEEAALETRIRATQIAALEADDYSSFASNTYARGFLLIYGRFLGVDVREVARGLESGNPISIAEYQYLNAYPEAEPERAVQARREQPVSRRPSLAPLIVFLVMLAAAGLGLHLYLQAQRLETAESKTPSSNVENVAPHSGPAATPGAATATTNITAPGATPAARPANLQANPTPAPLTANQPGDVDRAFVTKPQVPGPTPASQAATLPAVNELVVEPLKKTWVRIRRDDPNAEPIFDDVLYPKVGALKLKGTKFFLDIREPDAVTLKKNGQPLAYQPPGITIQ